MHGLLTTEADKLEIKVTVISGFLGAGKTKLIKKLAGEVWSGESIMVLENDFGEINIDAAFLKEKQIAVKSLVSGCICCSLVRDFRAALLKIAAEQSFTRVVIEPSGLSKLSLITKLVRDLERESELRLEQVLTVVDVTMFADYRELFGEFYNDQIEHAAALVCSRSQLLDETALALIAAELGKINPNAPIITTPWDQIDAKTLLAAGIDGGGEVGHDHGHHHSDAKGAAFESWSQTTNRSYSEKELRQIGLGLTDTVYGSVLRAKGLVPAGNGHWLAFQFEPKQFEVTAAGESDVGRISVIGTNLHRDGLARLFEPTQVKP